MPFEALSQKQLVEVQKTLYDLLENIMEQLQDREKYQITQEDMILFPPQLKKKFQEKISEMRTVSPDFEEYLFPSPFDTELPLKRQLLAGIEQGLSLTKWYPYYEYGEQILDENEKPVRKMMLPYKAASIIYECFARILVENDMCIRERKSHE